MLWNELTSTTDRDTSASQKAGEEQRLRCVLTTVLSLVTFVPLCKGRVSIHQVLHFLVWLLQKNKAQKRNHRTQNYNLWITQTCPM